MDTTHAIACAIQEAARVLGLGVPSYETAESVIGLGPQRHDEPRGAGLHGRDLPGL